LADNGIMLAVAASSKKHLVEQIADHAENYVGVPSREVFNSIMQRERLGTTGIGCGIAIPHAVFTQMSRSVVIMTILEESVSFDARHKPIDIVCTILGPKQADCVHLNLLTAAANLLSNADVCEGLRNARSLADVKKCLEKQQVVAA
jgi:PTS system nitrogen regulatory IIA component